ncbi:transmembrane protein 169-like [Stegostoma tigrinum]|uniref:transmembrane protein 169-like n=1 Tax=Stegostoma tigrinum TaxID=3053191 RepID=UPI00202B5CF4|nr:transmembrane protein 169-like [Stegostoma tigrinum]
MPQNNISVEQTAHGTHQSLPHKCVHMTGIFEKEGEATMERKKKKKKEPRPESIIIYRTGGEKMEEDQHDPDTTAKITEEQTNFLCPPSVEGFFRLLIADVV